MPIPLPGPFVKFIGMCEVLGAIGLILPGLLRIRPGVTTLAAACLVLLTICATVAQLIGGHAGNAIFAAGMGLICGFVAYGRWRLAPLREPTRPLALAAAG
jgi:hypothetical protein